MSSHRLTLSALLLAGLLLTGAALAGCRGSNGGGTARAATPAADAKPRANAFQHEYVASPQAHFDQMAVESREQEAARAETAAVAGKGRRSAPKPGTSAAPASSGFPAPNTGAPAAGFPAPSSGAPAAGFPAPSGPAPAPEPVARGDCEPNPCIGGDPCIHREPALPGCPPNGDVALNSPPRATR